MAKQKIDFNGMSVDDLLVLREKVDNQIAVVAESEVAALKNKMDRLQRYTRNQPKAPASARRPAKKPSAKPSAKKPSAKLSVKPATVADKAKRSAKKPQKVPAKYRDPVSGKTWSGRGMTPVWLREYEAKGQKREKFAV